MKKIVVIDGQGGKIGAQLIGALRTKGIAAQIIAIGTNSSATANMLKNAPDAAATGENPVIVACRDADIIVGPIGIVIADALYGEITPAMAVAVGQSRAARILIPMTKCDSMVMGVGDAALGTLINEAVTRISEMV